MDLSAPEIVTSGMVALVGPANAGKSTLMNRLVGQKVSIVSPRPQTTRNRIAGVLNGAGHQIVFIDTPGLHRSAAPLNREMLKVALEALHGVEAVVFMVDASAASGSAGDGAEAEDFGAYLDKVEGPVFLLLNKIDLVDRQRLLPLIDRLSRLYDFDAVIPLSALTGEGLERLVGALLAVLPRGFRYFPEDVPTDASERFLCAEIVREKVFLLTGQEIPYSSAVLIESFKEDEAGGRVEIHATIYLERDSQKGIVIGAGGRKIKQIGTSARKEIEELLARRVSLQLWVKVRRHWSRDRAFLRELGY